MNISIEHLQLSELLVFLREQANDAFPSLKDEGRLNTLAEKWHNYAEFCTCRDADNLLVGMIAFYANQAEEGTMYIPHVYVSSHYRCKGIFKEMLHEVEQIARIKDYNTIKLEVRSDNIQALNSYVKTGFTPSGVASNESVFMTKTVSSK